MEKLILEERKFKTELITLINNSTLPAFILKSIVKELHEQLTELSQIQYENALQKEKEHIVENKEKEEN